MELFRKEAVESFSSSSELNTAVRAVSIKATIFTVLLILCTAAFAMWLFFGTVYETVTVKGAIWPPKNSGGVHTVYGGTVSKTIVSEGDIVQAGDMLAIIPQSDILEEINEKKQDGASDEELKKLYDEYNKRSVIYSSIDGAVTYIVDENSYLFEGDTVASILPYDKDGNNKILTAFIPSDSSGFITLGMDVQVMPEFASREEYGYIKAYISNIQSYPLTGKTVVETGGNLLGNLIDNSKSYTCIEITLIPDMTSHSGVKWSNPESGDLNIAIGTVCTADIVVKKCHPYEWLF